MTAPGPDFGRVYVFQALVYASLWPSRRPGSGPVAPDLAPGVSPGLRRRCGCCRTPSGSSWWGGPPQPGSEWLRGYPTLAAWVEYVGLTDHDTVTQLLREARQDPDKAASVLEEARTLRSHLYACLTRPDDPEPLAVVARYVEDAATLARFGPGEDGLACWTLPLTCGLRLPVHAAARAAGELLTDPRRRTIRVCPSEACGWLFLDPAGMRRWCSMATCGAAEGRHAAVG